MIPDSPEDPWGQQTGFLACLRSLMIAGRLEVFKISGRRAQSNAREVK